ncbi:hypothetical protein ACFU96_21910 [Streptomyces sp. NPDC057620]|uniref:hypothetical protein n=1 Tax=Streptomyces sp. NPDC057620 TaxID=3346185 RepID=UPI0036C7A07B
MADRLVGAVGGGRGRGRGRASTAQSGTGESGTTGLGATAGKPSGTPAESDTKCTDQVDYAGDPRSNAEINSIGEDTGTCPPVEQK